MRKNKVYDKHLNLYYSYNIGNLKNQEKIRQLENNITRSLIFTLKHLSNKNQIYFVKELIGKEHDCDISSGKDISYDLQNVKNINDLNNIQKNKNKYLLTIENNVTFSEKELKKYFKTEDINERCIPDGWIFSENFSILIESKIGDNNIDHKQLLRHLINDKGYNLSLININEVRIINKTWENIWDIFSKINKEFIAKNYTLGSYSDLKNKLDGQISDSFKEILNQN